MKIAVVGVGGVGGFFGGKLALIETNDVYFLAREKTKNIMIQEGLRVQSIDGDFTINPVKVTDEYSEIGIADLVLVTVKSNHLNDIVSKLKPLIGDNTIILPLLNGMDALEQLTDMYGNKVMGGFCKIVSFKVGPGKIHHAAAVPIVDIGEIRAPISKRVEEIYNLFTHAGVKIYKHDDFITAQWAKMIFISATSAIGSITRSTFGEFRTLPQTREYLITVVKEIIQVAITDGAKLDMNYTDIVMKYTDSLDETATTSMQRDIIAEKQSELDFLAGYVVRKAEKYNISIPKLEFIYYCLKLQNQRAMKN